MVSDRQPNQMKLFFQFPSLTIHAENLRWTTCLNSISILKKNDLHAHEKVIQHVQIGN